MMWIKSFYSAATFLVFVGLIELFNFSWWWFLIVPSVPVAMFIYLTYVSCIFESAKLKRRPF